MGKSGELFDQEFETWTLAQARSFFRAGMVDDFFATNLAGGVWVLTLLVVGREKRQMSVQLRAARDTRKHSARMFKSLDAAIRAACEIGFDVRSIGMARPGQKSLQRGLNALVGLAHRLPDSDCILLI